MALTKALAEKVADKRGDIKIRCGFTTTMRDFDFNGLVVGDEFIIPETYEVRGQKMRGTTRDGKPIIAEYIFVETQNGCKQFFPGMFSKNVLVYEKTAPCQPLVSAKNPDGTPMWVHAEGTAVDKFREAMPDVNEGMKLLADECKNGKKIKIVSSKKVLTRAFDRDVLVESTIYTIDLV